MVSLRNPQTIKNILSFIEENMNRIVNDEKVYSMLEENIKPHVVKKLAEEIISPRAFKISCERIPPINIFKLVNKRLSKIYTDAPLRKASAGKDSSDQKAILKYEQKGKINATLNSSNFLTNAQRRSALEIYLHKNKPKVRILPAHQFLPYTEDRVNPLNMEVFIKFVGTIAKTRTVEGGEAFETQVALYHLYTDKEFMIVDDDGTIQTKMMIDLKLKVDNMGVAKNPFGYIPFVYINTSEFQLLPATNIDDIEFSLLILVLLTDLNYAVKYQAHSMIYTINIDMQSIDMNPDAILDLKSDGDEGEKSEVGTVKPEVDIPGTLDLIASTLKLYLESKGLKADVNATIRSDKAESGIHETIKNATLIEERKDQTLLYEDVEEEFWNQLADRHNKWRNGDKLSKTFKEVSFSKEFDLEVLFPDQKPVFSRQEKGQMLSTELEAGLTSQEKAMKDLHPEMTSDEIKEEMKLIKKEREERDVSITGDNKHNRDLANKKQVKDAANVNSTSQNENPNKR